MPVVVIRLGQSNSSGAMNITGLQAEYKQTFSNIKTWTGSAFASLNYAVNNNQFPTGTSQFSSEFTLLKGLQSHYGGTIYDIKYGVSGTALGTAQDAVNNWNINTRNSYYDSAISEINEALSNMWITLSLRTDYKIFIFWDQGEQDAQNVTNKNNYETNLLALANALMNSFGTAITNVYWINPEINQNIFQINATSRAVSAATNATPIVITTAAAHSLTTGQYVSIQNVGGNTAANGNWVVTVVDSTRFSLDTSVGNGAYTSGGNINSIYWKSAIQTAQRNVVSSIGSRAYSYACESYTLQSDGVHYDADGYKNKGDYAVNSIIIANNL